MRIIAGEYRGRKLEGIEGRDIRPTTDRVRESLFNILSDKIVQCAFLDLFAGTGAVAIEALSRGAEKVVAIDSSPNSIKIIRKNLENLKISNKIELYSTDFNIAINKLSQNNRHFDIIFVDPPYNKGIAQDALLKINEKKILAQDGIIVVEHDEKDIMPVKIGSLLLLREKKYGSTKLTFYITDEEESKEE